MSLEFGPGCLKKEELIALQNKDFELHCLEMKLEQCSVEQPRVYSGPGIIRQSSDGSLEFSLYAKESIPFEELMTLRCVSPGTVIPENKFFTLTATDLRQRKWFSARILPNTNSSGQGGTVCTGDIRELTFSEEISLKKDYLFLRLLDRIDLPYNTTIETTRKITDRKLRASSRSVLHFSAAGFEFYLRDDLDTLLIEVVSGSSRFTENIEARIIEALQFVLARPVSWSVMTKYTETKKVVSLRTGRSELLRPRIQPPITIELGKDAPFCSMFDKYLRHIIAYPDDRLHPISAHMRAICRASTGSINAEALTTCTAIESLLKEMKEAAPSFTGKEEEWLEKAKTFVKSWEGPERLGDRLLGLFGILNNPSPSSALHSLVQDRAVKNEHRKAWEKLRNKVAHGDTLSDIPPQELVSLCDSVLVLFYHLVFHQIGYQGKYTDYSEAGWPIREYPLPAEEQD